MSKLSAAVVGLNMGKAHLKSYAQLQEYELTALCDIDRELARQTSEQYNNVPYFLSYDEMLEKSKPDVVCIATPTALHCEMTVKAAESGAKGVYCEKPVAVNMAEAKKMEKAAKESGIPLVIGHQRRVSAPYIAMRKAIADGLVGDVYLIRGICAGDMLSDGTHTIDSLLFLNGDCDVSWLVGQIYRGPKAGAEEKKKNRYAYIGVRFGHNIERGAMACFQLSNGVRCEILCGDQMLMPGRIYQDIEIFGSKGRIWRNNDSANPPLLINTTGEWKELPVDDPTKDYDSGLNDAHRIFARTVLSGEPHPMSMDNAMRGFEAVMAVYESARTNCRIVPPLMQDEYPLDVLLRERGDI